MSFLDLTAPITLHYEFGPPVSGTRTRTATLTGANADFTDPGNGQATIRPSDIVNFSAAFPVTIVDDPEREPAEVFAIRITSISTTQTVNRAGFSLPTGWREITIAASDQPAVRTLTVTGPSTITETDGNVESGNYTIALGGGAPAFPATTTVTWTVTNGTTSDDDFMDVADRTGTVSFATTDTSQTFTLTIAGDNLNEAGETFTVQVSVANNDGGTAYGAPARTTITDDDPITATLPTATVTTSEGDTADFTVNLTGGESTAPVVITYRNDDATGTVTIATGGTTGTLTLTVTEDMLSEGQETLTIAASDFTASSAGAVTVTVAASTTLTINANPDDDITVTIAAPASANTGRAAEFTVAMSGASAAAVTVAYSVALTVDG